MSREEKKTSGIRRQYFFPLAQGVCFAITTFTAVIIVFFFCFYSTLYRISLKFFSPSFTGTEENPQTSKSIIGLVCAGGPVFDLSLTPTPSLFYFIFCASL
jgi:hypothetical protein